MLSVKENKCPTYFGLNAYLSYDVAGLVKHLLVIDFMQDLFSQQGMRARVSEQA